MIRAKEFSLGKLGCVGKVRDSADFILTDQVSAEKHTVDIVSSKVPIVIQ